MILINDPLRQTDLPRGCVATIGNFDGMHIGHQAIIRGVVERARETGRPSAVITFHPHPLSIVAPDRVPPQILTLPQKHELLRDMGVDALIVVPFTHDFSRWTADRFIAEFLVAALQVSDVRIGRDFCFGAGREGNLAKLEAAGKQYGFAVQGVDEVKIRGIRVSSSLVRNAIRKGTMRTVATALARTYFIDGRVATGRRLGRKIGFPTVNVDPANELHPGGGVYITTSRFESFSRSFESVTNIGVRPTFKKTSPTPTEPPSLFFAPTVYGDRGRLSSPPLRRRKQHSQSGVKLTNQTGRNTPSPRRYFL